jgi:hypothetical protein
MRVRTLGIEIAAGLIAFCVAGLAMAAPCYVILDRSDAVIYRDTAPPFDLSASNSPERQALRQRGQHLLIAEFDRCDAVGYISPTTGSTAATVDEIVMRLKPTIGSAVGVSSTPVTSTPSRTVTSAPSAPAPKKSAAPAAASRSY